MRPILKHLVSVALLAAPVTASAQHVSAARAAYVQPAPRAGEAPPVNAARVNPRVARGALVGGVVGALVAAGATYIVIESSDRDFGIDGIYYSLFVPIGAAVGALIGAIAGSAS